MKLQGELNGMPFYIGPVRWIFDVQILRRVPFPLKKDSASRFGGEGNQLLRFLSTLVFP